MNPVAGKYSLILASQSPRRQFLLKELGIEFETIIPDVEENYPPHLSPVEIARYLAGLKADHFDAGLLTEAKLLVTADTIVSIGDEILGKPGSVEEAKEMLGKLSGKKHEVVTGVCLRSKDKKKIFHVISSVWFKELSDEEIDFYIENFKPFDKAGSYGVQEWIGYIGISHIQGSFFNIMGLPVKELYEELKAF
ncbi:MAG: Maf family nucleotide pyrophosphatase [Syntrophothermus sp.]